MKRILALLSTLWLVACSAPPQDDPAAEEPGEGERPKVQAFAGDAARLSTRILYIADTTPPSSPGQIVINYGQPQWKPEYEEDFDELTRGKRWRFGNNAWTFLDSNLPFAISGAEISPGHYYLVLERSPSDAWYLVLLDPDAVRARKLDAFFVEETAEGIRAPLGWKRTEETTEQLSVKLVPVEGNLKKAQLEIRWGHHMLTGPIEMGLESEDAQ